MCTACNVENLFWGITISPGDTSQCSPIFHYFESQNCCMTSFIHFVGHISATCFEFCKIVQIHHTEIDFLMAEKMIDKISGTQIKPIDNEKGASK